jgi:hypothetical protein
MLAYALVKEVREKMSCQTKEITGSIYEFKYATFYTIRVGVIKPCIDPLARAAVLWLLS